MAMRNLHNIQGRILVVGFGLLIVMLFGVACGGGDEPTVEAPPVEIPTQDQIATQTSDTDDTDNGSSNRDGIGGLGGLLPEIPDGPTVSPPPAAPEDLVAELVNGALTLTWNDVNDIEVGYLVFRTTPNAEVLAPEIGRTETDEATFTDVSAQCGITYQYGVSGYNRTGFSFPRCLIVTLPDACDGVSTELEFVACESLMPVERPAVLVPLMNKRHR